MMENSEGEPAWGWQWNCGLCLHTSLFLFVIFFFPKSFWEPGANNKLLSCAISETWLTCRWTRCHFRCVSFMFLVSLSTLIPFFFFSFLLRGWGLTLQKIPRPRHLLLQGGLWLGMGSSHPAFHFEHTESQPFLGAVYQLFLLLQEAAIPTQKNF